MNIDFTGLENLVYTFMEMLANFDIKTLDFDWIATLLTFFAPIWNPIWAAVNDWLYINFGF